MKNNKNNYSTEAGDYQTEKTNVQEDKDNRATDKINAKSEKVSRDAVGDKYQTDKSNAKKDREAKASSGKPKQLTKKQMNIIAFVIVLVVIALIITVTAVLAVSASRQDGNGENDDFAYVAEKGKLTITTIKTGSTIVEIPAKINSMPVVAIAEEIFKGNTNIKILTIHGNNVAIGKNAFADCVNLETVSFKGLGLNLGEGVFSGCSNLVAVNLPQDMKTIAPLTFFKATSLESIVLPESITMIDKQAFKGCGQLKVINMPSSLENIAAEAFMDCRYLLESVRDEDTNNVEDKTLTIPKSVKEIGDRAFSGVRYGFVHLKFAEGSVLTHIGDSAFEGLTYLKSLELPSAIVSIGEKAFFNTSYGVSSTIVFPATLSEVGGGAFGGMNSLKIDTSQNSRFDYNQNSKALVKDGKILICYTTMTSSSADNDTKTLVIPEGIEEIANYATCAMGNYSSINRVELPSTLKKIGDGAFAELKLYDSTSQDAHLVFDFKSKDCVFGEKVFPILTNSSTSGEIRLRVFAPTGGSVQAYCENNSSRIAFNR